MNMIIKRFFIKGVDGNLTKLSSKSVMMRNGWIIDVEFSNGEDKDENNEISCQSKQFYGYKEGIAVGSVSTIFKGSGKANFKYENCGKRGLRWLFYLPAETATPRTPNSSGFSHSSSSVSSFSTRIQPLVCVSTGSLKQPSFPGQGMLGVISPLHGFSWHSTTCSSLPSLGKEEEEERQQTFFSFLLHTVSLINNSMSE